MSAPTPNRAQQLAYRRARLRAQCAIQRRQLAEVGSRVEYELGGIDRAVDLVRGVTSKPVLISAGVALLTLIGPKRALRWVTQGAFWYSTGRRLAQVLGPMSTPAQVIGALRKAGQSLQSTDRDPQARVETDAR